MVDNSISYIINNVVLSVNYDIVLFQAAKLPKPGLETSLEGPMAKKHAGNKTVAADKKKLLKDKKRTLKRLWNMCVWFLFAKLMVSFK